MRTALLHILHGMNSRYQINSKKKKKFLRDGRDAKRGNCVW